MAKVIPAINVKSEEEFYKKINTLYPKVKYFHFDVAKEDFCSYQNWAEINKIINFKFKIFLDLHLMVYLSPLEILRWNKSYVKKIFIHPNSTKNLNGVIKVIKKIKKKIYLAFSPSDNILDFKNYFKFIDGVLILGVNPGPSGQKLNKQSFKNIELLKKEFKNFKFGFDGGINKENIREVLRFEPEFVVIGSSIFKEKDPFYAYLNFLNLAKT